MKKLTSWSIALYSPDGDHCFWFHNKTRAKTLSEFKAWRESINGEILWPTFNLIFLVNRATEEKTYLKGARP